MSYKKIRHDHLDAKYAPDRRFRRSRQLVADVTDGELDDWRDYGIKHRVIEQREAEEEGS